MIETGDNVPNKIAEVRWTLVAAIASYPLLRRFHRPSIESLSLQRSPTHLEPGDDLYPPGLILRPFLETFFIFQTMIS